MIRNEQDALSDSLWTATANPAPECPPLTGRAEATRAADRVGDAAYEPVLSDQEWVALKNICGE